MKNFFVGLCAMAFLAVTATTVNAQSEKPAASPAATVTQMVGQTKISVEYSRPSVKERKIFAADGLLPYGKTWRTGANQANKFTFSTPVTIGGEKLEAGSYTMTTVPGADEWKVNLYKHESTSSNAYSDKKADASFTVEPANLGDVMVETFMIDINNIKDTSATINLVWENTAVMIPVEVPKTW